MNIGGKPPQPPANGFSQPPVQNGNHPALPMVTIIRGQGCLHSLAAWALQGLECHHRQVRGCRQDQGWVLLSRAWVLACLSNLEWVHHKRAQLQECLHSQDPGCLHSHNQGEWDLHNQEWGLHNPEREWDHHNLEWDPKNLEWGLHNPEREWD